MRGLSILLASLLLISPVSAQDPATQSRSKIGLVLSGGGARGGAHLGVLRVLREARVPIDVITGTSIGAVIGGLYAAGMTIEEIEAALLGSAWEDLLLEITPRTTRSFRRKRDDDTFLVKGRPGWNDREVQLPLGLIQGHQFDLLLSRWTLPVANIHDFDELGIPFRAVAADIVTGEAVVLGQGNLARAMRASLTIPSVIAPIEIDGRLLVDGGIANNLPIDVARDLGAEIIIAVDVSSGLLERESLGSVIDITNQLINMLGRDLTEAQVATLGAGDVFIRPDLGEQTASDFETWAETIGVGYEAAAQQRTQLSALGVSPAAYQRFLSERQPPKMAPPVIDFVQVTNQSGLADRMVAARLERIQLGQALDPNQVDAAIAELYGLELFENVDYAVVEQAGETGLVINAREKSWGPNYLQLGMAYSSTGSADSRFALAGSFLATAINQWGAEWRSTLQIGDEPALSTDFYQPLGAESRFFIQTTARFQETLVNAFANGERVSEIQIREAQLELAGGREFGNWGELRAGLRRGRGDRNLVVGDPGSVVVDDFNRGEMYGRFSLDILDSVYFPRAGAFLTAEWLTSRDGLGADEAFDQFRLALASARTWGRHTLFAGLRYNSTLTGTAPVQSQFRIGGFFDIGGLNDNELSGQHSGRALVSYYRRIGNIAYLPAYVGATLEAGNAWQNKADIGFSDTIAAGSLWIGADTPIGPVYVAYGRAETDDDAFYLFLGPIF